MRIVLYLQGSNPLIIIMGCSFTSIVFQPPKRTTRMNYKILLVTSDGNTIPAQFFNQQEAFTILISHGNAEDLPHVEQWVRRRFIPSIRANVMIYEYTGYISAAQKPSEKFVYSDCEAALSYLTENLSIPRSSIVLYGRSLGSGPSCHLAAKYSDLAGVILQTPITSAFRVLIEFRFTLPGDMFANIDKIREIYVPILLIHGTRDEVVPMTHSETLFDVCKSKLKYTYYVEGAGHNNIESIAGAPLFEAMQEFIDGLS